MTEGPRLSRPSRGPAVQLRWRARRPRLRPAQDSRCGRPRGQRPIPEARGPGRTFARRTAKIFSLASMSSDIGSMPFWLMITNDLPEPSGQTFRLSSMMAFT